MKISVMTFLCLQIFLAFSLSCIAIKDLTYSKREMNENSASAKLGNLINNQISCFNEQKTYCSDVELEIERRQPNDYKVQMTTDGKSFQMWATPIEYGNLGKMSFYADSNDGDVHGADHKGEIADKNDPIVKITSDEIKLLLIQNKEFNKADKP